MKLSVIRSIALSQGFVAIVDDHVFDRVSRFKWTVMRRSHTNYAVRMTPMINGSKRDLVYLHDDLLGVKGVDHRDGDGLNNRRSNLRLADSKENARNRRKVSIPTSSRFKGVHWDSRRGKWRARLRKDGGYVEGGWHTNEEVAARAYDALARKHFGEFARTNF